MANIKVHTWKYCELVFLKNTNYFMHPLHLSKHYNTSQLPDVIFSGFLPSLHLLILFFLFFASGGGNSGWALQPKHPWLLPRFKDLEDSIKEEQAHVKRLAERTQAISLMTEWGMRNKEIRLKSQTLQNSPLTRIKASNPINSMAGRGGGVDLTEGFFPPQVREEEKGKQEGKGWRCH